MSRLGLDWRDGVSITSSDTVKKKRPKGFDKEAKLEEAKQELKRITGDKKVKLISVEPILITKTLDIEPLIQEENYLKKLLYFFDDKILPAEVKGSSHLIKAINPGFDRFGVHIIITFISGKARVSNKWS